MGLNTFKNIELSIFSHFDLRYENIFKGCRVSQFFTSCNGTYKYICHWTFNKRKVSLGLPSDRIRINK